MESITFRPIGILKTPFDLPADMPIQPLSSKGAKGKAIVFPEFSDGLYDLDGFTHVIVIYYMHRVRRQELIVTPFFDTSPHGVFATRAPVRPNPLGISVLELEKIDGNTLYLLNVDMLNGSPLIDIKPYMPDFDSFPSAKAGWYDKIESKPESPRSDNRFD